MSNQITLITNHQLPGAVYNSAISESFQMAIESRTGSKIHFTQIDLESGTIRSEKVAEGITAWHSLAGFHRNKLVLQYFENKKNPDQVSLLCYDQAAGQVQETIEPSQIQRKMVSEPTLYLPESEGFETVKQFLGETIVVGCEYQEVNDVVILSYYLSNGDQFERKLTVLKEGEKVLELMQDENIKGFAPGSFFTFEKRLIFVKEKVEINIYEI